jgi:hypothetical protein
MIFSARSSAAAPPMAICVSEAVAAATRVAMAGTILPPERCGFER